MKNIIISVSLIVLIFITVTVLSVSLGNTLLYFESVVKDYEIKEDGDFLQLENDFTLYYRSFREKLTFLAVLMPDDILSEIEGGYLDIISYAKAENYEGALASQARLGNNLENARKLTTVGLMSVF